MRSILIYTKDDCSFCTLAKNLLAEKGMSYTESKVGKDLLREDFVSTFPDVRTMPFIIINGQKIGGYNDLVEYIKNEQSQTFLAG